jgi:hypothetical protein
VNGNLRRVRSGDQGRGAEEIEEALVGQPAAPSNDLVPHHRDVRGWASEGGGAQSQEERHQLEQRRRRLVHTTIIVMKSAAARAKDEGDPVSIL